MENYQILGRIGEGAHGVVLKAKHITVCHVFSLSVHNLCINIIARFVDSVTIDTKGETLYLIFKILLCAQTGELVALKKVPLKKVDDGIPNSALR